MFLGQLSVMVSSLLQTLVREGERIAYLTWLCSGSMFYRLLAPWQWGNLLIHPGGLEMLTWEDGGAELLNDLWCGSWPP